MTVVTASWSAPANTLEEDQLVANTSVPVPRAALSTQVSAWLWGLRVFTVVLAVLVVFVFVASLV